MEPDKQPLEAWENSIALGDAWWAFADADNKKRFRELQREGTGSHLGLQRSLEIDLVARVSAGELQAIGIEGGSDPSPAFIPQYYFSKRAEIDWDEETIAAFGKKFHEVRLQGPREPQDTVLAEPEIVDPWRIRGEWESADEPPGEPDPADESLVQEGRQSPGETPPYDLAPSHEPLVQRDQGKPLLSEPTLSEKRKIGRPPLVPMVREVIRELMGRNEFAGLAKWEIERLIRRKARERFPTWFPKQDRPTKNTINKALRLEGWPPLPK
jgi:hypothetical protein